MLTATEPKWTEGDYLNFKDEGYVTPGSKTRKFSVISRHSGALLGFVKWYVPWRQYTFCPLGGYFDKKCLREIADFCERETNAHREKRKVS